MLQIISLFTGCVFSINAANIYSRGQLYWVYVATFVFATALLVVYCLKFGRMYQYSNPVFLILIICMVIAAMMIQFLSPNLNLDWTRISFVTIIFYVYYNQLVQQIDNVTALLNRKSYESEIVRINRPAVIIFFDVDKFKYVNDVYGHGYGDRCLVAVSHEIRKVFEKYGYCYRYGGDEFCVVMVKNIDDVGAMVEKYKAAVRQLHEIDERVPTVSVGYAYFDPQHDDIVSAVSVRTK